MHFIFPKNYTFKQKLFGFIDYSTAILDVSIGIILYGCIHMFFSNITLQIYLFIALFFPIFLFSIVGIHRESFIRVLIYMFKFFKNQNVYLYQKTTK